MGLSGRKVKQRIGKDPRNLSWADDASRFGQSYLEKFGWDPSKGLGSSGEGRTSAIKASQKLDMLGIGMQHQKDPNGIAWRQNRDFENLLRRLNGGTVGATSPFHRAREEEEAPKGGEKAESETGTLQEINEGDGIDNDDDEREDVVTRKEKKKKKRKTAGELEGDPPDKKERKKRKKMSDARALPDDESEPPPLSPPCCPPEVPAQEPGYAPMPGATAPVPVPVAIRAPPRTHRARIIAAKRLAASNSTALAEILGIPSSSSSSSPYLSAVVTPTPTPNPDPDPTIAVAAAAAAAEAQEPLQKLTTSSQSVADYFKAKLGAKVRGQRRHRPALADPVPERDDDGDGCDHDNRPYLGLGAGVSRPQLTDGWFDEERVRGGIGTSSSKFAAMFSTGQHTTDAEDENPAVAAGLVETRHVAYHGDDDRRKREKKRAKEERRREKEERRRRRAEVAQADDAVVDIPIGEAPAGQAKKKKRCGLGAPDDNLEDTQPSTASGIEVIGTKKRKKGDKDKKSAKHPAE